MAAATVAMAEMVGTIRREVGETLSPPDFEHVGMPLLRGGNQVEFRLGFGTTAQFQPARGSGKAMCVWRFKLFHRSHGNVGVNAHVSNRSD